MLADKIFDEVKDYFKSNKYKNHEDENDNLFYLLCYIFLNKSLDFTTYKTDYFKRSFRSALQRLSNEKDISPLEAKFVLGLNELKNEKIFVSISLNVYYYMNKNHKKLPISFLS
jgi:hypothetical protein